MQKYEPMIRTITPNNLDEVQYLLGHGSGTLIAYFPLFDDELKTADYAADITWNGERFEYVLGGHGIGSNQIFVKNRDAVVDQIIADNQRFNDGNAFQIESVPEKPTNERN